MRDKDNDANAARHMPTLTGACTMRLYAYMDEFRHREDNICNDIMRCRSPQPSGTRSNPTAPSLRMPLERSRQEVATRGQHDWWAVFHPGTSHLSSGEAQPY